MEDLDSMKMLDGRRKAVLLLPNAAFKLWVCHWMAEDAKRESWLSIDSITEQTGMSESTIVRATKLLVKDGWLVDTGRRAADKWLAIGKTPTSFSYQVHVYRVEDPTTVKMTAVPKSHHCQKEGQGFSSSSGSGSGSTPLSPCSAPLAASPAATVESKDGGKDTTQTTTQTQTNPSPESPHGQKKQRCAKDGTPFPEDFFSWTDNSLRTAWLCQHDPGYKPLASVPRGERTNGKETIPTDAELEDMEERMMESMREEFPNQCASGDFGCLECTGIGTRKVGESWFCYPCWKEDFGPTPDLRTDTEKRMAAEAND
jgi:hypothetical protein